jgi:hypothetical protein
LHDIQRNVADPKAHGKPPACENAHEVYFVWTICAAFFDVEQSIENVEMIREEYVVFLENENRSCATLLPWPQLQHLPVVRCLDALKPFCLNVTRDNVPNNKREG